MSKLREIGHRIPPMALNALKLMGVLLAIALGLFAAVRLAGLIFPFVVAFLIACIVEPLVRVLGKRLRLSRGIASLASVLLVVALLAGALSLLTVKLASETRDFAMKLPGMFNEWTLGANDFIAGLNERFAFIDDNIINVINEALVRVRSELMGLVNTITRGLWNTLTSTPRMIVTLIVTILATFFLVRDRDLIARELRRQLPARWIRRVTAVRDDLFGALFGYLRALLILMLVTFVELAIGFSLVGVKYAVLFAVAIAILDMLPVLGTGTFVVPWAVYNFIMGDIRTAVGLLLVFCFVWVVRQLLEPRVVGEQIGVNPLLTLLSMYIGMRLMGVSGMILGPILLIIVRNLFGVYANGRTLREMLYEGVEMPEDEALAALAANEAESAGVTRPRQRAAGFFARLFKGRRK